MKLFAWLRSLFRERSRSYAQACLREKPIAYYHFGDARGTQCPDASGNGYDATIESEAR